MNRYRIAAGVDRVGYRVSEVAGALGMTTTAVYQQVASGAIESVKIGGRVFVPARFFRDVGLDQPVASRGIDEPRLGVYTVAQVAAALGSSIPNIYELTGRGVIPMTQEWGHRMIPRSFFEDCGLDAPKVTNR